MTPALTVVLSLALGATVSPSRFGIVATGPGTGLPTVLTACPRAVEAGAPLVGASAETVLSSYRTQCTGGAEILELPLAASAVVAFNFGLGAAGGQSDADQYWGIARSVAFGSVTPPSAITETSLRWVAGPADLFQLADPNVSANTEYVKGFVSRLATLVRQRATTAGATYSLVVPPWISTTPGAFCQVVEAARTADPGIAWSWSTTSTLPATVADEATTTFGFRSISTGCQITGLPIFVQITANWFAGGTRTATQIVEWMSRVDAAVASDTDVVSQGAILLRTLGGGFLDDLGPAAAQLATYLATPTTGGGGGGGGGTGANDGGNGPGGTAGGTLVPRDSGCGNPAGAASLLALAPLALRMRRRRR